MSQLISVIYKPQSPVYVNTFTDCNKHCVLKLKTYYQGQGVALFIRKQS